MKVGIVGAGMVGASAAYAMIMRGIGREIVLVDLDDARANAEADDLQHATPFSHPLTIRAGSYADLADAVVVIIAAGVSQREGETRMSLLGRNNKVFQQVVPSILEHAPDAILLVATNPVDVMTHVAAYYATESGARPGRVLGTGTTLDTARFRTLIADRVGVDAQHVHAYVLGEHGDTEVLAWSTAVVGTMQLDDFGRTRGIELSDEWRQQTDNAVRRAAYKIVAGKGATYYGVGSAIARIVDAMLGNRRSLLTVCSPQPSVMGVDDVTVALPTLVGGAGVLEVFDPVLSDAECDALAASARAVRAAINEAEAGRA